MATAKRAKKDPTPNDISTVVVQPVRSYRLWTPSLLRSAEIAADSGNIRLAVDIVEWLLSDDKIRGALDGRIHAVFSQDLKFEESGDKRRSKKAVTALRDDGEWDAIFPAAETSQIQYWAILLGIGPYIHSWQIRDDFGGKDGHDVPVAQFFHPQPLRWDWAARGWFFRTYEGGNTSGFLGAEEQINFGDGVWCAHTPYGPNRPWSLGLWRAIAPWALLKQYARADFGRLGETASRVVVESDKDTKSGKDVRLELATAISQAARDGVIIPPPGFNYKLVEASANTAEVYKSQIQIANDAIALAIRGNNLTTQINPGAGSKAAASVHAQSDEYNASHDAEAWAMTTHDQTLVYWAERNYGDRTMAPWVTYSVEPDRDHMQRAQVLLTAMQGLQAAQLLGFEINRDGFIEEFEFGEFLDTSEDAPPPSPPQGPGPRGTQKPNPNPPPNTVAIATNAASGLRLASGASAKKNSGFVSGQLYADSVADKAGERAADLLRPMLREIADIVAESNGFEELRTALVKYYRKRRPPVEFADLMESAMTLAQVVGAAAVLEDVPELSK